MLLILDGCWGTIAMIVINYMSVCLLVGLHHLVSNGGAVSHHGVEIETIRGRANSSRRIGEDIDDSYETRPSFLIKNHITQGHNDSLTSSLGKFSHEYNDSVRGQIERRKNETGIPSGLFFEWWSVVRPFGNEMVSEPKFPWTVAVMSKRGPSNLPLCSGIILTKLYVLSTCRCLSTPTGSAIMPLAQKDPSTISITAGMSALNIPLKEQLLYGQIRDAMSINLHPHCTVTQKYDYAVIELEYYLYYTRRVLPIPDPFSMVHGKISEEKEGRLPSMQENDICQAAGWPTTQTFWGSETDEPRGEQKLSNFKIVGKDRCLAVTPFGHQLVCTKAINATMPTYGQSVDAGSGLVCENQVTAILSHHSGDYTVFSSLRGALSFLWEYYEDQNEIYVMSSSRCPTVSSVLPIFTIHVPIIATYL